MNKLMKKVTMGVGIFAILLIVISIMLIVMEVNNEEEASKKVVAVLHAQDYTINESNVEFKNLSLGESGLLRGCVRPTDGQFQEGEYAMFFTEANGDVVFSRMTDCL